MTSKFVAISINGMIAEMPTASTIETKTEKTINHNKSRLAFLSNNE
jgi:hypothetical protein